MKKKLIKNIELKGLTRAGGEGKTYEGLAPVIIDNTKNEISLDQTNLATKNDLDKKQDILNDNTLNIFPKKIEMPEENSIFTDRSILYILTGRSIHMGQKDVEGRVKLQKNLVEFYKMNEIVGIPTPTENDGCANKLYVDTSIKTSNENNQVKFDSISEVLTEQEKLIDKNILDINNNKKNIDQVILENKGQINFLGTYDKSKNYMENDSVVEKDIYYISIIDNNKNALSDTTSWFKTSPSISIDLSNYYTKIETNNLLLPLEKRLNDIDIDSANQQIEIDTNKTNISLRYTKDETLTLLNEKVNASYFDSEIVKYQTKIDAESDYNSLADDISTIQSDVGRIGTRTGMLETQIKTKQKKLTAGKNITIDNNNVISATGGSEEVWENVSIQNTTQGFNILNIGNYKKIRIVSMDFLKIYTNIESDYMGSAISSNTIYLDENINQNIPLTTNESSPYCVGGYLLITSSGVCNFNVRFYKNGNFGNSSINSYVGTIKVKGVKK